MVPALRSNPKALLGVLLRAADTLEGEGLKDLAIVTDLRATADALMPSSLRCLACKGTTQDEGGEPCDVCSLDERIDHILAQADE